MAKGRLWTTKIVHQPGDDELIENEYYRMEDTALKKVNHMDITLCKFKINKSTLYKLIKIEPYLLTLETYN